MFTGMADYVNDLYKVLSEFTLNLQNGDYI